MQLQELGVSANRILLQSGDMVTVRHRDESKVYVMGEIARPSALPMRNGRLSLNEALGEAGGPNLLTANTGQIYVIRNSPQGAPAVFHLNASAPQRAGPGRHLCAAPARRGLHRPGAAGQLEPHHLADPALGAGAQPGAQRRQSMKSILVVCEGNICRSPMAQGLLAAALPQVQVHSAGLGALIGSPADETAVRLMQARGIDISAHRATQITRQMCVQADMVLVMDADQRKRLEALYPAGLRPRVPGGRVHQARHPRPVPTARSGLSRRAFTHR